MKSHSKGEKPTVSAAERRKKEARSSSGRCVKGKYGFME